MVDHILPNISIQVLRTGGEPLEEWKKAVALNSLRFFSQKTEALYKTYQIQVGDNSLLIHNLVSNLEGRYALNVIVPKEKQKQMLQEYITFARIFSKNLDGSSEINPFNIIKENIEANITKYIESSKANGIVYRASDAEAKKREELENAINSLVVEEIMKYHRFFVSITSDNSDINKTHKNRTANQGVKYSEAKSFVDGFSRNVLGGIFKDNNQSKISKALFDNIVNDFNVVRPGALNEITKRKTKYLETLFAKDDDSFDIDVIINALKDKDSNLSQYFANPANNDTEFSKTIIATLQKNNFAAKIFEVLQDVSTSQEDFESLEEFLSQGDRFNLLIPGTSQTTGTSPLDDTVEQLKDRGSAVYKNVRSVNNLGKIFSKALINNNILTLVSDQIMSSDTTSDQADALIDFVLTCELRVLQDGISAELLVDNLKDSFSKVLVTEENQALISERYSKFIKCPAFSHILFNAPSKKIIELIDNKTFLTQLANDIDKFDTSDLVKSGEEIYGGLLFQYYGIINKALQDKELWSNFQNSSVLDDVVKKLFAKIQSIPEANFHKATDKADWIRDIQAISNNIGEYRKKQSFKTIGVLIANLKQNANTPNHEHFKLLSTLVENDRNMVNKFMRDEPKILEYIFDIAIAAGEIDESNLRILQDIVLHCERKNIIPADQFSSTQFASLKSDIEVRLKEIQEGKREFFPEEHPDLADTKFLGEPDTTYSQPVIEDLEKQKAEYLKEITKKRVVYNNFITIQRTINNFVDKDQGDHARGDFKALLPANGYITESSVWEIINHERYSSGLIDSLLALENIVEPNLDDFILIYDLCSAIEDELSIEQKESKFEDLQFYKDIENTVVPLRQLTNLISKPSDARAKELFGKISQNYPNFIILAGNNIKYSPLILQNIIENVDLSKFNEEKALNLEIINSVISKIEIDDDLGIDQDLKDDFNRLKDETAKKLEDLIPEDVKKAGELMDSFRKDATEEKKKEFKDEIVKEKFKALICQNDKEHHTQYLVHKVLELAMSDFSLDDFRIVNVFIKEIIEFEGENSKIPQAQRDEMIDIRRDMNFTLAYIVEILKFGDLGNRNAGETYNFSAIGTSFKDLIYSHPRYSSLLVDAVLDNLKGKEFSLEDVKKIVDLLKPINFAESSNVVTAKKDELINFCAQLDKKIKESNDLEDIVKRFEEITQKFCNSDTREASRKEAKDFYSNHSNDLMKLASSSDKYSARIIQTIVDKFTNVEFLEQDLRENLNMFEKVKFDKKSNASTELKQQFEQLKAQTLSKIGDTVFKGVNAYADSKPAWLDLDKAEIPGSSIRVADCVALKNVFVRDADDFEIEGKSITYEQAQLRRGGNDPVSPTTELEVEKENPLVIKTTRGLYNSEIEVRDQLQANFVSAVVRCFDGNGFKDRSDKKKHPVEFINLHDPRIFNIENDKTKNAVKIIVKAIIESAKIGNLSNNKTDFYPCLNPEDGEVFYEKKDEVLRKAAKDGKAFNHDGIMKLKDGSVIFINGSSYLTNEQSNNDNLKDAIKLLEIENLPVFARKFSSNLQNLNRVKGIWDSHPLAEKQGVGLRTGDFPSDIMEKALKDSVDITEVQNYDNQHINIKETSYKDRISSYKLGERGPMSAKIIKERLAAAENKGQGGAAPAA